MNEITELATGVQNIFVRLHKAERQLFGTFIDCNMSSAWVGDRFRIFPGKYGEDPVWGDGKHLKIGEGSNVSETFALRAEEFTDPILPPVVKPEDDGLHGSVWFETIHQDKRDSTGRTLYSLYHNENYPSTLVFKPETGVGLSEDNWPPGLKGDDSIQAVPRIGIMKSLDGGDSWVNLGIILEDRNDRMIRLPINKNYCFPGGVGDPSAVSNGEYLYVFFGEYSYPGEFNAANWSSNEEASGQCVSVARIALEDLDKPEALAKRWDGESFSADWNQVGKPIKSLQISRENGGGAVSQGDELYYWGPSVSWNDEIQCWVMLLGRVDGPYWVGGQLFLSINVNKDLGSGAASQEWSTPIEIVNRPGHTLWYPSLQPDDSPEALASKRTCLNLGKFSRLWFKDMTKEEHVYLSDFVVEFLRK
jgi:hypothetical protein